MHLTLNMVICHLKLHVLGFLTLQGAKMAPRQGEVQSTSHGQIIS